MPKILTLPLQYTKIKKMKIWVLETKVSCLAMQLMSGIPKSYTHILMFLPIRFAKRWLFKERMVQFLGLDQIANLKLLLSTKNLMMAR